MHVLPKGFHRIRHYGLFANGNRAANIARARELLAVPPRSKAARDARSRSRPTSTARAAASMPLLRRPHDHHRDLRARLPAEAPPHARSGSDQDRHLMTPSPPIDDRSDARHSRWLSASNALARAASLNSQPGPPPILSHTVQPANPPLRAHQSLCGKPIAATPSAPTSSSLTPRPNPHSARGTASALTARDFVPWRFSDAGRMSAWRASSCRRPKTCTGGPRALSAECLDHPQKRPCSGHSGSAGSCQKVTWGARGSTGRDR